jgi:hypothetical protein
MPDVRPSIIDFSRIFRPQNLSFEAAPIFLFTANRSRTQAGPQLLSFELNWSRTDLKTSAGLIRCTMQRIIDKSDLRNRQCAEAVACRRSEVKPEVTRCFGIAGMSIRGLNQPAKQLCATCTVRCLIRNRTHDRCWSFALSSRGSHRTLACHRI